MAQLYFRYGAMNSGKTIDIIKVAHNYEEEGKSVIVMTSSLDDRYGKGIVASRIGLKRDAFSIKTDTDVFQSVQKLDRDAHCVLVDESQFLKRDQVIQLARVVDELGIPVIAFGLKNDFQNHLFEGSEALLTFADKIEEIKTVCWFCDRKAIMPLRFSGHHPVYEGNQVQIGGNDSYYPVCRKHYYHPPLDKIGK